MQLSDTTKDAEAKQIGLLRAKTTSERLSLALSLSNTVIGLSRRALKRANPALTDLELNYKFIQLHYGNELADNWRQYLQSQHHASSQ